MSLNSAAARKKKQDFENQNREKIAMRFRTPEKEKVYGSNEEMNKRLHRKLLANISQTPASGKAPEPAGESGLVSTLVQRVSGLENEKKQLHALLHKQDMLISSLKKEKQELRCQKVEDEMLINILKKKIDSMERFFNDYGMVWVGENGDSDEEFEENEEEETTPNSNNEQKTQTSQASLPPSASSTPQPALPLEEFQNYVDVERIKQQIATLNALAGEDAVRLQKTGANRGVLKKTEQLPLTLFKNGFMLWSGPFRSYELSDNQDFVRDLMDGFFPWEFSTRYPDGVPMQLIDYSTEVYRHSRTRPLSAHRTWGVGRTLGGKTPRKHHAAVREGEEPPAQQQQLQGPVKPLANVSSLSTQKRPHERVEPVNTFLDRLPEAVIREGRIIPIRKEIRGLIQGESPSPAASTDGQIVVVPTPVVKALESETATPVGNMCTVKVTFSKQAQPTLILKLTAKDTIGDLRGYVARHHPPPFEVRTLFPTRVHEDETQTLQDAGLFPNGTVLIFAS